jgi:zinc resistance-associated protein
MALALIKAKSFERRNIMKRRFIILAGLLLVGLIATAALAHGGGRGHGGWFCDGNSRGMMKGFYGLNLTADQTAKMDTLRDNHWKEVQPLRDKMFAKRSELRTLWLETNPDAAKINAAQKEVQVLRSQMEEKRTAFHLSALNLLTPEQKAEMQKSYRGRGFGQGRGMGDCSYGPGSGGRGPGRW